MRRPSGIGDRVAAELNRTARASPRGELAGALVVPLQRSTDVGKLLELVRDAAGQERAGGRHRAPESDEDEGADGVDQDGADRDGAASGQDDSADDSDGDGDEADGDDGDHEDADDGDDDEDEDDGDEDEDHDDEDHDDEDHDDEDHDDEDADHSCRTPSPAAEPALAILVARGEDGSDLKVRHIDPDAVLAALAQLHGSDQGDGDEDERSSREA